jgi:CxxC motif-containing protein (DUF1111 family)
MAGSLFPTAQQWFDNDGNPLAGGSITTYVPGTTTLKTSYSDAGLSVTNTNPVVLDSAGRASIFGDGSFKYVTKTSAGVTVETRDTVRIGTGSLARLATGAPANSAASGSLGDFYVTDSYLYVYGATGWRRVAISSF